MKSLLLKLTLAELKTRDHSCTYTHTHTHTQTQSCFFLFYQYHIILSVVTEVEGLLKEQQQPHSILSLGGKAHNKTNKKPSVCSTAVVMTPERERKITKLRHFSRNNCYLVSIEKNLVIDVWCKCKEKETSKSGLEIQVVVSSSAQQCAMFFFHGCFLFSRTTIHIQHPIFSFFHLSKCPRYIYFYQQIFFSHGVLETSATLGRFYVTERYVTTTPSKFTLAVYWRPLVSVWGNINFE